MTTETPTVEIPDTPSPKDVALMLLSDMRDKLKEAQHGPDIAEFVRTAGWPQYTCGPKRADAVNEQISKAVDRMFERVVDTPLKKRGIK